MKAGAKMYLQLLIQPPILFQVLSLHQLKKCSYLSLLNKMKKICCLLAFCFLYAFPAYSQAEDFQETAAKYWHDKLAQKLGVRADEFKLYQGSATVGATNGWLWNILNAVSSNDSGVYYNPAQFNSFAGDYSVILNSADARDAHFSACNLNTCILNYCNATGTFAWDKTITDVLSELNASHSLQFIFDTSIQVASGTSRSAVNISIAATFNHIAVSYSYPYNYTNAEESQLGLNPWYSPCVFNAASTDKTMPNWSYLFGPNGCLQRICRAVVTAEDVNVVISITSASVSTFKQLKRPLPRFFLDNCAIQTSENISNMSTTMISTPNVPIIMGVLTSTVPDYIRDCPNPLKIIIFDHLFPIKNILLKEK